uniref:MADS-box domain-containing protein n=1 Tax=Kalanchoe fedtschenkoi TaxID=63787 RepID=A0A7N1A777_KALFE
MTRKKVQLAWITNPTARRATFRKRRENLIRKLNEISVLAGTDACGIILSPFEGDPPVFWPPSINDILGRFFSLPELEQYKRMVSIESYMRDEISKLKETIQKERREVKEAEVSYIMNSIHSHGMPIETLGGDETSELFWYFEELKKKCDLRLNQLDPNASAPQPLPESQMGMLNNTDLTDPWLNRNCNNVTNNMQANYDYATQNNNNNNNGFGTFGGGNNIGMAGPDSSNPPYSQPPFESHHGFFSNSGMAGPSSNNASYPQPPPPFGSHKGFYSEDTGY